MRAHKSPLILNNFFLLNLDYQFRQPDNKSKTNVLDLVDDYNIDIDFAFQNLDKETFQLFTKIGVNDIEEPLSGYILFIEGVCVFSFDKQIELSEQGKSNLLHFSGLNICINSLRNILSTITANGPFGRYTLPSIDVSILLDDKHKHSVKGHESKS
jgi:preprotein translocase subunit SecB